MRQAADILSSAPAMQIRYLEAMQAMAKSANSKVIFLPGSSSVGAQTMAQAFAEGEHKGSDGGDEFQRALNARVIENI